MNRLNIGPTPNDEACAQVGSEDYHRRARLECRTYIEQLIRVYGEPPDGCRFVITANPHDYGTYHDVEIEYSGLDSLEYALRVEMGLERWDAISLIKIGYKQEANGPNVDPD